MALDFCIGQESTASIFSIDEQMHIQLFLRTDALQHLPQFQRMSSYFADVSYEGVSLASLLREVRQVIPAFAGRPKMQETLRQLEDVCHTAIAQEKGLYGFCD
jgi:hypothetical protein